MSILWLKKLMSSYQQSRGQTSRERRMPPAKPKLEVLEDRITPTADFNFAVDFGGTDFDQANSIAVDSNGDIYVTGTFGDTADFDGPGTTGQGGELTAVGSDDTFVARYDSSGTFQWVIQIGGADDDIGLGIAVDSTGVYVTGNFEGAADFDGAAITGMGGELTAAGSGDMFIAKYDSSGVFQWANQSGGTGLDIGSGFGVAVDGTGVYVTGEFDGTADFDGALITGMGGEITSAGLTDIFVVRYDTTGAFQWASQAGGTGDDRGLGIAVDNTEVYVTGAFQDTADFDGAGITGMGGELTSAGLNDIFVAQYDTAGMFQWANRAGGTGDDISNGIAINGNNVYLAGSFENTADFDGAGMTGQGGELTSSGDLDIFVVQYDASGDFQWANRAGGGNTDEGLAVAANDTGVYVTGRFRNTADFDGPGMSGQGGEVTSAGFSDIFLAEYDRLGNFQFVNRAGGNFSDEGFGVALDGTEVYVTGFFRLTADFDGPAMTGQGGELTSSGSADGFIWTLTDNDAPTFQADLSVVTLDDGDPILTGDSVTYTVFVSNNGPQATTGAMLDDVVTFPGGTFTVSAESLTFSGSGSGTLVIEADGPNISNLSLANGETAFLTFTVTANSGTGTITNTATVSGGSQPDPDTSDNTETENTTVNAPVADLSVTKSDNNDPILTGGSTTYTVLVTNNGPQDVTGAMLDDAVSFPTGTFTVSSESLTFSGGGTGTLVIEADGPDITGLNLASGETATLTFTVTANSGAGIITNTATVSGGDPNDPIPDNDTVVETTTVNAPAADLEVTKSDNNDPILIGGSTVYTVLVTNNGPQDVTGAMLDDAVSFPTGTFTVSSESLTFSGGGTGTLVIEADGPDITGLSLASGETATLTFTVTADTGTGTITNTATASGGTPNDPDTNNNTAIETTTVNAPAADLEVVKSDNNDPIITGGSTTYTVLVTNNGPQDVTGATLDDSVTFAGGTFTVSSESLTFSGGGNGTLVIEADGPDITGLSLASGETATLTFTVTADSGTGTITNTATVSGGAPSDPDANNDTAIETTTVNAPAADLSVVKSDNNDPIATGGSTTYTVLVTNNGPQDVTGAMLDDTVTFAGGTFTVSSESLTFSGGGTGTLVIEADGPDITGLSLASGETATLTFTVTADSGTGTITNTATVSGGAPSDPDTNNDMAVETTTVLAPSADLEVTKSVSTTSPTLGSTVTFTITVTNNAASLSTATGVELQDLVPDNFGAPFNLTPSEGVATVNGGNDVSWTGVELAPGETATLTFQVTVGAQEGTFTNFAEVTASDIPDPDSTPGNGNGTTAQEDDEATTTLTVRAPIRRFAIGSGPGRLAEVRLFNPETGQELVPLAPFDNFQGGVRVAVGDVNGDGDSDIVVGAGFGSANGHVKVFDGVTGAEIHSFFAFMGFNGGVNVGVADVNNDGADDILVSTAIASDHVKVFDGRTGALLQSFQAYDGFTGGVTLAGGDFNNDQVDDIITGTATGFNHVKVFDGQTNGTAVLFSRADIFDSFNGGVFVSAADFNQDGFADLIVGAGPGATPHVKVFSGANSALVSSFLPFAPQFTGGVRVSAGDVNGDNVPDLLVGSGFDESSGVSPNSPGLAGPAFAAFDGDPFPSEDLLVSFFVFEQQFGGGIYPGGADN